MKKPTKKEIEVAYQKLQLAKDAYKTWDEIMKRLIDLNIESVKTNIGVFQVVDLFADNSIVWKSVAMKQYELKKVG